MYKYLISIVGPTAIGKTSLAIQLAEKYSTEIISADSRQFYREMNIGTAKPSVSELNSAKHHLINNKSVVDNYSIGEFEQDAIKQISNIHSRSNIAVLVGGSGLYLDVINYGLDQIPKTEKNIRNSLNNDFESKGLIYLQNKLKKVDLITYNNIDLNNSRRIIRALEVTISNEKPYSSFLNKKKVDRDFKVIEIGINAERELVYQRINNRVDDMVNQGLINEVKKLIKYKHLNSLNTIGYKEIFRYLNGDISLEFAVNEIKKNSRRFAKRQITWFKKDTSIKYFSPKSLEEIIKFIG